MKRIRGFTLIELLVAASIFSVAALSVYSAFRTGILSYNKIDSAFNIYQTARLFFNRIELDLNNSFNYCADESKFKGSSQNLDFFSVTDSFLEGSSSPNISCIKYNLENTELKRAAYQGIGAFKENLDAGSEDLYPDIKKISFQYAYLTGNEDKPYVWQDSWPSEDDENQKKSLPAAVKIELSVGDAVFTKVVSLPWFS